MKAVRRYGLSKRAGVAAALLAAFALGGSATAGAQEQLSLRLSDQLTERPTGTAPAKAALQLGTMDYRIGADDLLEIQVFGVDQLTRTVRVNSRGQVSLPLVGTLQVGGLTAGEAERMLVARLAENYLQDPQVSLFIKEYTSQRVTIEGAVNKPGVYPLRGPTTLLQSLAVAGGQASMSDMTEVMLFRAEKDGKRTTLVYDVDRIRTGELEDPSVINEDLIVVKRSPSRVFMKDSIVSDFFQWINPLR